MIKASPMIDLSDTLRTIPHITCIHIVCVKGECKEVLVVCQTDTAKNNHKKRIEITVADLDETYDSSLQFRSIWKIFSDESGNTGSYAEISDISPSVYLYDPNAGIHKLNCSDALCKRFSGLKKLSPNTDLYVSEFLHDDFPGRKFRITEILDKKSAKSLKGRKSEVIVRNYTMQAEALRKKLHVISGDDRYVFGFKAGMKQTPMLALCERLA